MPRLGRNEDLPFPCGEVLVVPKQTRDEVSLPSRVVVVVAVVVVVFGLFDALLLLLLRLVVVVMMTLKSTKKTMKPKMKTQWATKEALLIAPTICSD